VPVVLKSLSKMPVRREHNRLCRLLGLNSSIANDVNYDKDLPVKDIGRYHRGFNHGACANLKYRCLGGTQAVACSIAHNMSDRIQSRQFGFLRERAATWYPGKLVQNSTLVYILDGRWWLRNMAK